MPQSVDEILAGAKETLANANKAFPSSSPAPPQPQKPSYTAAHAARKAVPSMGDELAAKGTMVDKAKQALK
jgi:hypothetical protein